MTIPCSPRHLFWEAVPDGLDLSPFTVARCDHEEDQLGDEVPLNEIDGLGKPTVYLDQRWWRCSCAVQNGRIIRLGRRIAQRGGRLVLYNLADYVMDHYRICRFDRLEWWHMTQEDLHNGKTRLPDPAWLTWGGGIVLALASTIRETQDYALMPILGDALEDAGCISRDILDHLHGPGPHVPGCFALELLFGQ